MTEKDRKDGTARGAEVDETKRNRREFLKKAAKAATVAPAVTLLMSTNTKPALATHS